MPRVGYTADMLTSFLRDLFEHGYLRVDPPGTPWEAEDLRGAEQVLREAEPIHRAQFPGSPPAFCPSAALWAARCFYHACQPVTYRDLGATELARLLQSPGDCPQAAANELAYSVDLVFRFLPDLFHLVQRIAPQDPLLIHLQEWANQWPLSSVGIPAVVPAGLDAWLWDPQMVRYYADRVIAKRDRSRLAHPVVRAAVVQAIGPYADQFPELTEH